MKKIIPILKKIMNKFPVTTISSVLCSLVYVLFYDKFYNLFEISIYFLIPLCVTSFMVESIFDVKKEKLYYILSLFMGLLYSILSRFDFILNSNLFVRLSIFLFISEFLLAIYYNYKKSNTSFSKYLVSCFSNILKVSIIYLFLNIGFILILLLIDSLFIDGFIDYSIDKILILLLGVFYIPSLANSINEVEETDKFINTLVSKILFGLVILAYVVIYIYVFKILITINMPTNVIFRILFILFVLGHIINIMARDIETNKILKKINNLLPYLFIPFILLQIYSLGLRISENGLTIVRYLGIVAIIFEIIYTVFYIMKRDEGKLIFVMISLLFITLCLPFINCYTLSINNQYKYLEEYKENHKVTGKVKGAYNYLNSYTKGQKLIKELLTEEDINLITDYKDDYVDYYYNNVVNTFNIEGYTSLEVVHESSYDTLRYPILLDKLKSCINGNEEMCFENNNEIIIENQKLIVTSASYSHYTDDYFDFDYYVLSK